MKESYVIADKAGKVLNEKNLSESEARMVAKAGFRVFENDREITPQLTGLFGGESEN